MAGRQKNTRVQLAGDLYFTRGLLAHRAVNPLCVDERPTSTGIGDADAAA